LGDGFESPASRSSFPPYGAFLLRCAFRSSSVAARAFDGATAVGDVAVMMTSSLLRMGLSLFCTMALAAGCAKVRAGDGPSAERVFSTDVGFTCFLVRDETGKAVGGNCVKDD